VSRTASRGRGRGVWGVERACHTGQHRSLQSVCVTQEIRSDLGSRCEQVRSGRCVRVRFPQLHNLFPQVDATFRLWITRNFYRTSTARKGRGPRRHGHLTTLRDWHHRRRHLNSCPGEGRCVTDTTYTTRSGKTPDRRRHRAARRRSRHHRLRHRSAQASSVENDPLLGSAPAEVVPVRLDRLQCRTPRLTRS
jgi:hypothetical protein